MNKKRTGYATLVGPGYKKQYDTRNCVHCNRNWVLKSDVKGKGEEGGFCTNCMNVICPECVGKACFPFMKRLERYEQKMRLRNCL